jgi:hypothetical protein
MPMPKFAKWQRPRQKAGTPAAVFSFVSGATNNAFVCAFIYWDGKREETIGKQKLLALGPPSIGANCEQILAMPDRISVLPAKLELRVELLAQVMLILGQL